MRNLLFICLTFALFSCKPHKELVSYQAYKCNCKYPDAFGFDKKTVVSDTGTKLINSKDVVKRTNKTITVEDGFCQYKYLLTKK